MDFENRIKNINDKSFVDRRINQLKYLIFESLGLPKDNISIDIKPMPHHSKHSNRVTDVWNIEFFIDIVGVDTDPILSEIAILLNNYENSLNKVFKNVGINQFLEFVKNPDRNSYDMGIFVSSIELDGSIMRLNINIDYETITVEGADDL
jgi:hypothetical protein